MTSESAGRSGRCVIVGAAGFIGSHLAHRLRSDGVPVVGIIRAHHDDEALRAAGVDVVRADATSRDAIARVLHPGDVIFDLAGASGAATSFTDPAANLIANCGVTLALLQAAVALEPRPRIVFAGSRLQYGRVAALPVAESHVQRPTSPYGLHKSLSEAYLALYFERFGVPYAVARMTNPYGGDAGVRRPFNVFDQLIRRAVDDEEITIFGDGSQLRDYLHVDDVCEALVCLARAAGNPVVNVGSGEGIALADAVRLVVARAGGRIAFVPWPPDALAVETGSFYADITLARTLGFTPRIPFAEGVERTIARVRAARGASV
jgi:UDP-glucose 4-epimerase